MLLKKYYQYVTIDDVRYDLDQTTMNCLNV